MKPKIDASNATIGHLCDPDHLDICHALNSMMRAALEQDEDIYDAMYDAAMRLFDEHHEECSKVGGFEP